MLLSSVDSVPSTVQNHYPMGEYNQILTGMCSKTVLHSFEYRLF